MIMDIVMTGYAGLTGAKALARQEHEVLRRTLTEDFLQQLQSLPENVCELPEDPAALPRVQVSKPRRVATGEDIPALVLAVPVAEGGVYEALWKLGEMAQTGLNADLADIPIRQEVIEVCEILDINPYQLPAGCLLYLADNGRGCPGRVIGQTTRTKGRTITGGEGTRYLDKPRHGIPVQS